MLEVNVKEARSQLSALLSRVKEGEEIAVTRHGRRVACIVPPPAAEKLPSLARFRSAIPLQGGTLGEAVNESRRQERY